MRAYVGLLRGINVGGKNSLPMEALRALLVEIGCCDVATYIQSGNVVLKSEEAGDVLARKMANTIRQRFGFEAHVLVMTEDRFLKIANANPYFNDDVDSRHVHVCFMARTPINPDLGRMRDKQSDTEHFTLTEDALYLKAPDGIGRSKLASAVERLLGVPATGRNWKTVCAIAAMLESVQ